MLDTHVRITSQQHSRGALSTYACPAPYVHQIIVSPQQLGGWMLVLSPYTDEAAKARSHKPAKVTAQKGQSWDFIPRSLAPRACSLMSVGPAQTLSWVLVPEVRPTASWPWSRGVRAQQGTGQQSGVWLGFEKKPGPPSPQEGELSSGGRGWGAGCLFLWECPTAQGTALGPSRGAASPLCPPTLSIMALEHGHYQLPAGSYPRPAPASKPTPCPGQDLVQSRRMKGGGSGQRRARSQEGQGQTTAPPEASQLEQKHCLK